MKKRMILWSLIITTVFIFSSCSNSMESLTGNVSFQSSSDVKTISEDSFIQSIDQFGWEAFKEEVYREQDHNVIISPVSLFTALNLLANGAQGGTKEQMKTVLNTRWFTDENLNHEMNRLINYLNHSERYENTGFTRIYNSIWIDKDFSVKKDFIKTSKAYYDSDIFSQELSEKSTVDKMNKWISEKSGGLIENPISEMSPDTFLSVLNVLHFKGKWVNTFDKTKTKPDSFYLKTGDSIEVNMMNDERFMDYYEDGTVQAGSFNYYNGKMLLLLPKTDMEAFIKQLDTGTIHKYVQEAQYSRVKVKIPVFSVEYKNDVSGMLKNLGMVLPFDMEKANFEGIKENNNSLWIGQVLHDCVVHVDEEGTEAAALSAVMLCGSGMPLEEIKEFYVNKPFVFVIQDNSSDLILFIGKVERPVR